MLLSERGKSRDKNLTRPVTGTRASCSQRSPMSSESENNEDESQMETQALDTLQDEVEEEEHETLEDAQEQEEDQADDAVEVPDPKPRIPHPKKTRKEPGDVVREPGKSLLPHSKVHSIIKADTVGLDTL